ncbi:hypothetical protein ACLEEB_14515 [Lonsdalea quercina]|uniref:hypothetical protein n=1 Tax=Lonsdalea quercina TaxID=71657 RepID=UPI003976535A
MEKLSTARQIIEHTDFAEFPETVTHARLCAAFARLDGRSIPKALRAFAQARVERVQNADLKRSLREMSNSMFPEGDIGRIKGCISRMESFVARELGVRK